MDYLKETTIEELKSQYSEHHGFVFSSSVRVSDQSIEKLVQELKTHEITKKNPVLVCRLEDKICFVFDDFDGPKFFSYARMAENMGLAKITPLCFFLRDE